MKKVSGELLKKIALLDHIYGETRFMNAVNKEDLSKEAYEIYFSARKMAETQENALLARCSLKAGLYDLREENAANIRKTGQKLVPAEYDIISIRKIDENLQDLVLLQESHRQSQNDIGDVYVISRGRRGEAFFVDEKGFYPVSGFITKGIHSRVQTGVTAAAEYQLLSQAREIAMLPEAYAGRYEYLAEHYAYQLKRSEKKTHQEDRKGGYKKYSDDDIEIMRNTDIIDLAKNLGYHVKKVGKVYTTEEHDSIRFFDRKTFCRFSDHTAGNAFNFLMSLHGMTFKEAAAYLADFNGIRSGKVVHKPKTTYDENQKEEEKREFLLPPKSKSYSRAYAYLSKTRGFSGKTLRYLIDQGLIYEEEKHGNIIFCGKDKDGVIRQAFARGTYTYGKPFKVEVTGSDKNYGFTLFPGKEKLAVFEAAIDAISYAQSNNLFESSDTSVLAMGGTADKPLYQYICDHPEVKEIHVCLDNDEAGDLGTKKIIRKYKGKFFMSDDRKALKESGCKDFNELLVKIQNQSRQQNQKRL